MELMIKMSAAEADEAMAKGLIQALIHPFSCREEVRKAAEKPVEKPEEVKTEEPEAITSMPQRKNVAPRAEWKPVETEQETPKAITSMPQRKNVAPRAEWKPVETEQKAEQEAPKAKQTYTLDQLSKAAADLITSDAGKQTALLELLHKFEVESMPELKADDYPAFAEGLRALGGKL